MDNLFWFHYTLHGAIVDHSGGTTHRVNIAAEQISKGSMIETVMPKFSSNARIHNRELCNAQKLRNTLRTKMQYYASATN